MSDPPGQRLSGESDPPGPAPSGGCACGAAAAGGQVAVVGVRLHGQARVTQYNSGDEDFETGERVVVEADRLEVGEVALPTSRALRTCNISCMRRVLRVATPADLETFGRRLRMESDARDFCRSRIRERGLPMKLVDALQSEGARKIIFTFTADGRVDFRDLVRDLARRFRSRIELRQIGVRDEARVLGGYGDCGKALCCSSFLKEFAPISIRMAREQNLSLNPSKISGMCGRLKCCLRYEYSPPGGAPALEPEDEPLPPTPQDGEAPAPA
ncbi:MAG: stage 0 sporulation family protein [Acidobacteriota bacterium]